MGALAFTTPDASRTPSVPRSRAIFMSSPVWIPAPVRILQKHHAVLVMEEGKVRGVITKHDLLSLVIGR